MKNRLNPLFESYKNIMMGLELLGQADYHEKRMRNNRIGTRIMVDKICQQFTPI